MNLIELSLEAVFSYHYNHKMARSVPLDSRFSKLIEVDKPQHSMILPESTYQRLKRNSQMY